MVRACPSKTRVLAVAVYCRHIVLSLLQQFPGGPGAEPGPGALSFAWGAMSLGLFLLEVPLEEQEGKGT